MDLIKFTNEEFIKLDSEARFDFHRWELENKFRKEKQCRNTIRSCRVGVFCEAAIKKYLNDMYSTSILEMKMNGRQERYKKTFLSKRSDIELELFDGIETIINKDNEEEQIAKTKNLNIEIKGISQGQPKGQVLVEHIQKYIKKGTTHLAFCELFFDENNKEATVEVYLKEDINKIINDNKKWMIANNKFGKPCYTPAKYLHMVKAHK